MSGGAGGCHTSKGNQPIHCSCSPICYPIVLFLRTSASGAIISRMAEEPPKLTVASETDAADLEKAQAERELSWETREMAANLLRVIRGAGRPYELPQQIINLGEHILETHKTARAWAIWSAMEEALQSAMPDFFDAPEHEAHIGVIAQGSLQFVASRLLHQRAQEAAGEREIESGIEERERYFNREREKRREEYARFLAATPERLKRKAKKAAAVGPKRARPAPPEQPAAPAVDEQPKSTVDFMRRRQREMRGQE